MKKSTVCFSGYRPKNFSFILNKGEAAFIALRERTGEAIIQSVNEGYTTFICGMAEGFDLVAGSVLLERMESEHNKGAIRLIAALPFEGHGFLSPWQVLHQLVLSKADEVITLAPKYHPEAYHDRNRYMVDNSSRLICYFDGKKGGTDFTVKYARAKGWGLINVK